jgi:hypothetical protein
LTIQQFESEAKEYEKASQSAGARWWSLYLVDLPEEFSYNMQTQSTGMILSL